MRFFNTEADDYRTSVRYCWACCLDDSMTAITTMIPLSGSREEIEVEIRHHTQFWTP